MDTSYPTTDSAVTLETAGHVKPRRVTCRDILVENVVLFLTLTGVVIGFAVGFGLRELDPSSDALMWIGMPGELFLRFLNMIIFPLIIGSVISGGDGESSDYQPVVSPFETQDIFADLLRNFVPSNAVEIGFRKARTDYSNEKTLVEREFDNGTLFNETVVSRSKSNGKADGMANVLGLIVVCLVFGIAANRLGKQADVFVQFFSGLTEIVLLIMRWFFWTTPLGVASLIAKAVSNIDDLSDSFSKLGMFLVVVVVGIAIVQFLLLSLLLLVLTRRNPLAFHFSVLRPYLISFASTSTAVAIPEMMYCCEVKNNIDPRVARFAVPFSVTLGANGSAVFITSSAIFIAQFIGHPLTAGDVAVIAFLTAVSAMALPPVPSASLVTLVIILAAVNIPSQTIALLFAVEWFTDRIRTGCNLISHCYCAAVAFRFCMSGLKSQDHDTSDPNEINQVLCADDIRMSEISLM